MVLFGLSALYHSATGVYYFFDSEIPIAVFLGLHLLITDPSTSPRTAIGRTIFGVLYGSLVFALYGVLGWLGVPTFYDKLLCVPLLNLCVPAIDRLVRSNAFAALLPRRTGTWEPRHLNLAHMAVWVVFFIGMSSIGAVSDTHEGHYVPFWQQACEDDLVGACRNLLFMEFVYCDTGSGWACNELGVQFFEGVITDADRVRAAGYFDQSCQLGFAPACDNSVTLTVGAGVPRVGNPRLVDFQLLLELEDGKGPLPAMSALDLYSRGCDQGWLNGCANVAQLHLRGDGVPEDHAVAATWFERACDAGEPSSCANLGLMHRRDDGVNLDEERAAMLLEKACRLGLDQACLWLEEGN